eukprot:5931076-Alexandrium_andersonii.AAC.1
MSASLVGSEMCIRDSCSPHVGTPRRTPGSHIAGRYHSFPWSRRGSEGLPVSYTHLTLPTICSV